MIRHWLKVIWNRKSSYILLGLEFLVCFLIVTAVATSGIYFLNNYRRPLGFEYRDVWAVTMAPDKARRYSEVEFAWTAEDSVAMQQVYRTLRDFEEIEVVAEDMQPPFMGYVSSNRTDINGHDINYDIAMAGDGLDEVLDLEIVAGRWFDASDNALPEEPVVINQHMARQLFGEQDPVGQMLVIGSRDRSREYRLVGVVSDHRHLGLWVAPYDFMFQRVRLDRPVSSSSLPNIFLVRVRPGTPRSFEQYLREQLQAVAPGWTADVSSLEERRAEGIRQKVQEFRLYGVLGGSLLLMVALGLVGVLWQSVTQRTQEIGIRRATGAQARHVYAQFTGEMLVLTTLAVVVGVVLVLNLAVLDLFPGVGAGIYAAGLLAAAGVLYGLVIAAALYPGWLATRVQPAQALHYE